MKCLRIDCNREGEVIAYLGDIPLVYCRKHLAYGLLLVRALKSGDVRVLDTLLKE